MKSFFLSLCLLLFTSTCLASRFELLDRFNQCQLNQINALEPDNRVESEAGLTETWNSRHPELQCAGVSLIRRTIDPKGLHLPSYSPAPQLILILQGKGVLGISVPGCPDTYEEPQSRSSSSSSPREQQERRDSHQKIRRFYKGDIIAIPPGTPYWTYNHGNEPLVAISLLDTSNFNNQLDSTPRVFYLGGNPDVEFPETQQQQQEQEEEQGRRQRRHNPGGRRGGQHQQKGEEEEQQEQEQENEGGSVLSGFSSEFLAQALNTDKDTAKRLQSPQDERKQIVKVEEGLQHIISPDEEDEEDEDQEESRRRSHRRHGEDEEDEPRKRSHRRQEDEDEDEDEEEQGPRRHQRQSQKGRRSHRREEDEDEDDDDEEEEDRHSRRHDQREEEEEEQRPARHRRSQDEDEDEEDEPSSKKSHRWSRRHQKRQPSRRGGDEEEEEEEEEEEQEERRTERHSRQSRGHDSNGIEETICTAKLHENIARPSRADLYNPRAGRISTVNSLTLPILRHLRLGAEYVVLYKNGIYGPHWTINANSLLYVIRGRGRVQIVNCQGNSVFDDEVRRGQLLVVPQNFVVAQQAGDEGLEYVVFKTNDRAAVSHIKQVFRATPAEVLKNAFGLRQREVTEIKFSGNRGPLVHPQSQPRSRSHSLDNVIA